MLADERGLIFSWLAKLVLGFAIVAVVIFDAGAILVNFFTLDSTADEIAVSITTETTGQRLDERLFLERAQPLADEAGARLVAVEFDPNGKVVKITLRRKADTLVVGRISWIKNWARATAEGQSGTG